MESQYNNKRKYRIPEITQITMDNEISLALESEPPTYESNNKLHAPEYFNNEPFKTIFG